MASCSSSEVGDTYAIWTGYDCLITSVSFNSWRETNNGTLYLGYMTDPNDLSTFHSLQALTPPVYTSANVNNATFAYTFNNNEIPYGAYLVFCWQQTNESNVRSVYLDNVSINYILPRNHIANIASNTQITWAEFAAIVNAGYTYENKTVYLDEDIDATTMVGTNENICFQGTFEGNGNTITFNHTNNAGGSANWYHGLFRYLNGATIQNLKVNGTITTNAARCGGLAGHCYGDNTITNCLSDITINSSLSSDGTYGGFVSIVRTGTTTFEGCAFTGKLLGSGTYRSGGLVGCTVTAVVFNNCVFDPTEVTIGLDNSATFSRKFYDTSEITVNNSYFTYDFNDGTHLVGQGKQCYTITGQSPISIVLYGTATNHNMSHITTYSGNSGLLYNGTIIAGSGDQVRLNLNGGSNSYLPNHGTLSGSANPYTLTMAAYNTVISPFKTHIANTATATAMTWAQFAQNVNNGTTYEGMTVYLDEDITATTMAGTSSTNCFKGTLEGNCHTLTFITMSYDATDEWIAPFKYLNGATIQNLKVDGTITTSVHRCAGLVAQSYGNTTITNCLSDITINSSFSGDGSHGGFVSFVYGSTTIEGCTFTGRLLGSNTYSCAGFIGWVSGSATFNNCVFDPTEITIGNTHSATFGRRDVNYSASSITVNNCYYTFDFNDGTNHVGQGKQRYTITGQNPVSVALNGTATDHGVSHITAYNGTPGLLYNGTIIAGEGDQVRLNLNGGNSYLATHGTLTGNSNPHILTMEASNTEISAAPLYSTDFEDGCDWTFVNGNLTNKWYWGYAASNGGTHGLYISNNGGTTNTYTKSSSAMVYAYKTLDFEAGVYSFSYDWLANGEHNWDFLRVALVPASVSLEASTEMPTGFHNNTLPEGWIALDGGSQLNQSSNWQTETLEIELSAAGQYMMVFAWRNDGFDGTNPPAAIDNVRIEEVITPVNLTVSNVTATTADLSWTAMITTDSYTMKYRPFGIVFTEGFENGLDDWTLNNCDANTGIIYGNDAHSGGTMFGFHNNTNPPQYLISPKLSGVTEGMRLEFYYNNWSSNWPETFQVGFSTTDNATESFTFGDEITVTDVEWHLYSETIPAGTKYISWKHTSYDQLYLYIDDIMVGTGIPAGAWQTATVAGGITEVSTTLTGLTPATNYEAYVYPDCDPDKMSDTVRFTTEVLTTVTQTIALQAGWNWLSFNVETTLNDLKAALVNALPGTNIQIKSKDAYTKYTASNNKWRGSLNALDMPHMYKIQTETPCEITLTGMPINAAENAVTISNGANWIAYPLLDNISLLNAFSGFAVANDVILSKDGYAQYKGGRWRGSISELVPGQGYIYKSTATGNKILTW
jgi:hypothetical protein